MFSRKRFAFKHLYNSITVSHRPRTGPSRCSLFIIETHYNHVNVEPIDVAWSRRIYCCRSCDSKTHRLLKWWNKTDNEMPLDKMNGFSFDSLVSQSALVCGAVWHESWISITILWALHFDRSRLPLWALLFSILFEICTNHKQSAQQPDTADCMLWWFMCSFFVVVVVAARVFVIIIHIFLILPLQYPESIYQMHFSYRKYCTNGAKKQNFYRYVDGLLPFTL